MSSALCLAGGVEGVGDELAGLAPRDVVSRQETRHARRAGRVGGVAADYVVQVDLLHEDPEGVVVGHVGEGLLRFGDGVLVVGGECDDLGGLASRYLVAGQEAGDAGGAGGAVTVAGDYAVQV